ALFEGAEEPDWAGPWPVLAAWSPHWPRDRGDVLTVARTRALVTCAKRLRVLRDPSWASAPRLDVPVSPGGKCSCRELCDEAGLAADPRQRRRKPPVPAAEDRHQRRHEERPHDRRIDQNGDRQTETELLQADDRAGDEAAERGDHDDRRGSDDAPRALQAVRH